MEKTIKSIKKPAKVVAEKKDNKPSLNVNEVKANNEDLYPITLKKTEIKRVLDMYTGTKNTPKTSIVEIQKILKVDKKQIIRVLHKHGIKRYKESSLK